MTTLGRPDEEAPTGSVTGDVVMMNQSPTSVYGLRMRRERSRSPPAARTGWCTPTRFPGPDADAVDRFRARVPDQTGPGPRSGAGRALLVQRAGAPAGRRRP